MDDEKFCVWLTIGNTGGPVTRHATLARASAAVRNKRAFQRKRYAGQPILGAYEVRERSERGEWLAVNRALGA